MGGRKAIILRSVAGVAQLVEQRIRNAKVVGSTPISGTNNNKGLQKCRPFVFGTVPSLCQSRVGHDYPRLYSELRIKCQ